MVVVAALVPAIAGLSATGLRERLHASIKSVRETMTERTLRGVLYPRAGECVGLLLPIKNLNMFDWPTLRVHYFERLSHRFAVPADYLVHHCLLLAIFPKDREPITGAE